MDGAMAANPPRDCDRCPRLRAFVLEQRAEQPTWFNAPVPSFGDPEARLAIVGLAPGLQGANRTGRPFTGDHAGELLYGTLSAYGFAHGTYGASPDDGLRLTDCLITNAVRCVPPQNKPTGGEIATCRMFLIAQLRALARLTTIIALGRIAHDSVVRSFDRPLASMPFAHGAEHPIDTVGPDGSPRSFTLIDSYHCSRYNTNTGRLTEAMFRDVFAKARARLEADAE